MKKNFLRDVLSSMTIIALFTLVLFPAIEPGIIGAATTAESQVVTMQQVTAEISMTVASTSITMLPAIPGLTGGTGYGSTTINVLTNNTAGYTVTILASSTAAAMQGDTQGGSFTNYTPAVVDSPEVWIDTSSGGYAQFGFSITASSTGDLGRGFSNGYSFGLSSTTAREILKSTSETAASGSTSTLAFRAHIPANSSPSIPQDWYTATTTLTATMN